MKKLFFIMALACCIIPRALGSPPSLAAFSAKWTPFQFQTLVFPLVVPVALFDCETPVYGLDLTFVGAQKKTCGLSCGVLSIHGDHYGLGVALAAGGENNYGLMCSVVNAFDGCGGVAVGVLNFNCEDDTPAKPDNFLQIGLFNYARNGLQIGVLNYNPDAPIPWMVLFNYSSRERQEPTIRQEHDDKEKDGK